MSEVLRLQDEITHEVNTDASHLAESVFGKTADMPDMARVSDEQLADTYRRAYQRNDRTWLHQEAQRDPEQFLRVAQKLGVQRPPEAVAPTVAPSSSPAPTPPGPESQVPGPAGQVLSQLLGPMMAPPPAGLQPSSPPSPGLAGPVAAPLVGP